MIIGCTVPGCIDRAEGAWFKSKSGEVRGAWCLQHYAERSVGLRAANPELSWALFGPPVNPYHVLPHISPPEDLTCWNHGTLGVVCHEPPAGYLNTQMSTWSSHMPGPRCQACVDKHSHEWKWQYIWVPFKLPIGGVQMPESKAFELEKGAKHLCYCSSWQVLNFGCCCGGR